MTMSQYKLQKCAKGYSVVCGWDRPLQTFFVQIRKSHQLIVWKGTNHRELPNLSDLRALLVGIAQIPPDIASALESEKIGGGAWKEKVFDKTEVVAVLSEAREAKSILQVVTKIHENLQCKQEDRKISTVEGIMLELLELSVADKRIGEDRDPFGEENRDYVRNLGERANRLGGMETMQNMYYCMYPQDRRDLERAWHSIGDWLS
jgi:hypothetical protein